MVFGAMFLSVGLFAEIPVRNATHPLMMSFYLQSESYLHDGFAGFRGCTYIPMLLSGYYSSLITILKCMCKTLSKP